jgi:threonine/homoserine/homoserine lactone efflux protein
VSLCALGVSALLVASQHFLVFLRIAGVVYLTYLGFRLLFARADSVLADAGNLGGYRVVVVQGFLTSITNPKALLFYTAFLPQFVSSHAQAGTEILAWGALYILVALGIFLAYGLLAAQFAEWLTHYRTLAQRVVGLGLMGSALTLLRWRAQ